VTAWDPNLQVALKMLDLFQISYQKQLEYKFSHLGLLAGRAPKFIFNWALKCLQLALDEECESISVQESPTVFFFFFLSLSFFHSTL
jgi:hypothetical protein